MPLVDVDAGPRHGALHGQRVLVTGANGFLGRHVVAALLDAGCAVRAAMRRPSAGAGRWPATVEICAVGDLGPETDWAAALAGVDAVVHAAAHVHVMRPGPADEATFERVNVQATQRLAQQAAAAGVRRFVFVSSIMVNGEDSGPRAFRAEDDPHPVNAYARSKLAAEALLLRSATGPAPRVAVVRPPLVYGPGVGGNFARLIRACARGWPLPLAAVDNRRSLISVWNLADFVLLLLWHPQATGRVWLVSDGEDVSTPDLLRRTAAAMGRRARLVAVPTALLNGMARFAGLVPELRRLTGTLTVDAGPARRELGWSAPLSLDAGLARTLATAAGRAR
jgi:nucleoside-diphosphate-sugar epimerase